MTNFDHNLAQRVPAEEDAALARYIIDQRRTGCFRFGRYNSDYNGCGWIAIFNALQILRCPQHPAYIIRYLEQLPPLQGGIFGGLLGTYPWSVARYFTGLGHRVRCSFRLKTIRYRAADSPANILFYQRRNGSAHYVTFRKTGQRSGDGEPVYLFLNYADHGMPNCYRATLGDFCRQTPLLWKLVLSIR